MSFYVNRPSGRIEQLEDFSYKTAEMVEYEDDPLIKRKLQQLEDDFIFITLAIKGKYND